MGKELVSGEMIRFEQMTAAHTAQIAELEKICFSDPWSERSIASEIDNPLSWWLVAVDENKVVGYIGSQTVIDQTDIMNVAVAPGYRRQGIGEKLVELLAEHLKGAGVKAVLLEVRISNAPAICLYEKLGFQAVGLRKNYYANPREDGMIMRKELV